MKISRYNSVQEYVIYRIRLSIKDKEKQREREREGSCRRGIWKVSPSPLPLSHEALRGRNQGAWRKLRGLYVLQPGMVRCPCNESFTSRFITAVLHNRKEETRYRKDTSIPSDEATMTLDPSRFIEPETREHVPPPPPFCAIPLYKFQAARIDIRYSVFLSTKVFQRIGSSIDIFILSYITKIMEKFIGNLEISFFFYSRRVERLILFICYKVKGSFFFLYMWNKIS